VSAFATNSRLVLGQEAVFEKSNEITAIPALIERLDLKGALVSTDAMGCQTTIAQSTLDAGADYLLAVKDNQPTLHAEIESYFATAKSRRSRPSTRYNLRARRTKTAAMSAHMRQSRTLGIGQCRTCHRFAQPHAV
jgi:predicted transposase YbfD/YdcC